jgi:hypothetical protein
MFLHFHSRFVSSSLVNSHLFLHDSRDSHNLHLFQPSTGSFTERPNTYRKDPKFCPIFTRGYVSRIECKINFFHFCLSVRSSYRNSATHPLFISFFHCLRFCFNCYIFIIKLRLKVPNFFLQFKSFRLFNIY